MRGRRALAILERDLPRSIGRKAEARGREGTLSGLGVLSDQPTYPLAYHAMSVAALARALQVLGDDAPAEARELFRRAMLAQASYMAPDGDVAFLGRAQGESWALAATAYAGESCARMFQESHARSAGICATLAIRAVRRLEKLHGFHDGLLAIVPRFRNAPPTDEGIERYARVMTFNGLSAMFLGWAGEAAASAESVEPLPLPLDGGGSFVDPDRSRMAVVRRDSVWFAVHTARPAGVTDLRYDVGVLALKFRRGKRWVDVLPPRPTYPGGPLDGGGPALVTPDGLAFPRGTDFAVDPQSGEVVVNGGYRTPGGRMGAARDQVPLQADRARRPDQRAGARGQRAAVPGLPPAEVHRGHRARACAEHADRDLAPVRDSVDARVRADVRVGQRARPARLPALRHRARRRAGHVDARRTATALDGSRRSGT